jgi:hypothetical protein
MIDSDRCEECNVNEATTEIDCIQLCYRCAKKLRKKARVRERYEDTQEEFDDVDRLSRRAD